MTINELEKRLHDIGVPKEYYSILSGGLPNEVYCITNSNNVWEVYYSERGNKSSLKTFDDEEDACKYFFHKMEDLT